MKKICICTTISLTMKAFVVETAIYLHDKCGYDVTLICNEDTDFEKFLPDFIHFIPVHMARGIDFSALSSIKKFIKIFKEHKFDMVQYSTPNAACYASIASRYARVPIRLYCQWGIRYVGMKGSGRIIFKNIEKMICWNSTDIRAVSPMNKAYAVSEGLYPEYKATVVGKGGTIGVDMFKYDIQKKMIWRKNIREKYNIFLNDFVFGFVGRISLDKGCTELLSAFRKLESENRHIKLFIVGPVDDNRGISLDLLTWARQSKNVIMTGLIDSRQIHQYYAAMDVLVHPTYREGFGMVIQEAGALAVPVITTDIPGASEVMENGISSIHVKVKDEKALKAAMESFIKHQDKAIKYGKAAYERTKQFYDRKIMLENQREDYQQLLER